MVKLDKIYTRGGDKGITSLGDGKRVKKNSIRIKACGDIDEANSSVGIACCFCSPDIKKVLKKIQNHLFDIGGDLCVPEKEKEKKFSFSIIATPYLEKQIDKNNQKLETLNSFILPGGSKPSSFLHMARAIVRRSERSITELSENEKVNPEIIKYINRLSDFLFVAARIENKKHGDILWIPNKNEN